MKKELDLDGIHFKAWQKGFRSCQDDSIKNTYEVHTLNWYAFIQGIKDYQERYGYETKILTGGDQIDHQKDNEDIQKDDRIIEIDNIGYKN